MATIDWKKEQIRDTDAQLYADNATLEAGQLAFASDLKLGKVGPGAFRSLDYEPVDVVRADADYDTDQRDEVGEEGEGVDQEYVDDAVAAEAAARTNADELLATDIQGVQALAGTTSEGLATETAARIAADSALSAALGGKADNHKLNGVAAPTAVIEVRTGTTDNNGELTINLSAYSSVTLMSATGVDTFALVVVTDPTLATYTLYFTDIAAAPIELGPVTATLLCIPA